MPVKILRLFTVPMSLTLLILVTSPVQAKTVSVPLQIELPLLQQLLTSQLFRGSATSTELLNDPSGCSEIILSDPQLSELNQHLQIQTRLKAKLGMPVLKQCMPLLTWHGYAQVISDPKIKADNPRLIYLHILDSHLIGEDKQRLTSGPLWEKVKHHIHPLFNRFRLDLNPSINELKSFLPAFLPHHSQPQLDALLGSLRLEGLAIQNQALLATLNFEINAEANAPPTAVEQTLNAIEQQQFEQRWQSMDALLTNTIKHYAAATELKELRLALFNILLDARYRLQDALQQDQHNDPVRSWFIDSWSKLMPVLKTIAENNPQHAPLALLTLTSASDTLQTLDKLGPAFGLEISVEGLRRLARMINHSPELDLLQYHEELDPELLRLFQLPKLEPDEQLQLNFWPIGEAQANRSLDNWIPTAEDLDAYLASVRKLLLDNANRAAGTKLNDSQRDVFKKLVLTTAWQESCWRQYIVESRKIVPLRSSTGDTGIMQVNERVWRGFINPHQLRWDIAYNVQSGSRILLNYLINHALKKGEHKLSGGLDNLARATYSAYNGGPGQIARYRSNKVHQKIDRSFYDKYQRVKQGDELAVAQCHGKNEIPNTVTAQHTPKTSPSQKPKSNTVTAQHTPKTSPSQKPKSNSAGTSKQIHDQNWVKHQAKRHLTLQLGVFGSRAAAVSFIQQFSVNGNYAIYRQKNGNFTVLYGRYSKRQNAEKEARWFKGVRAWIRTFVDIQPSIAK